MLNLCLFRQHRVTGSGVRNQGFEFGHCGRCGDDMIRSTKTWKRVPKGFRVVWRLRSPRQREAMSNIQRLETRNRLAVALPDTRTKGTPFRSTASLVMVALRCLYIIGEERIRHWRAVGLLRRTTQQSVLRLPSPSATGYGPSEVSMR